MWKPVAWVVMMVAAVGVGSGCSSPEKGPGPYRVPEEGQRNTSKAEELTRTAADLIDVNPERAEELLREALSADLFHGPAHNNLGVVFLVRGKLYEAAHEFEWARKLMPGHPDPRVNLALTLEGAGKTDDALAAYEAALEVYPDYLPAIMGAASLTVRIGRDDKRLSGWMEQIAMHADDPAWGKWATFRLTRWAALSEPGGPLWFGGGCSTRPKPHPGLL